MKDAALLAVALCAGLAFFAALATWLRTSQRRPVVGAAVTLIVPVSGSLDLCPLMMALSAQTLSPRKILFTIESVDDPAHRLLREAMSASNIAAEIVVAGRAIAATQKCHNLARALAQAEDGHSIVVLADADILPQPSWLADLIRPVAEGGASVVSGYRWAMPTDARAGSLLCAWVDRAIASIPKMPWQHLAWAGSLALNAESRRRLGVVKLLETGISDDLGIARAAADAGIPIVYRMRVLVPSPVSHSVAGCISFASRQYQMLKLYQPAIWTTALVTVSASLAVRSGLWVAAAMSGFWFRVLLIFLAANLATYAVRLLRAQYLGCLRGAVARAELSLLLMPLLGPLIDAMHLIAILRGGRTRRIDWAHLSYEITGRRVVSISRRSWG